MIEVAPTNTFLSSDELYPKILSFISEFASTSRYYNLDSLSGIEKTKDPLHIWKEIQDEIIRRHGSHTAINNTENHLINSMRSFVHVAHTDEKDNSITDFGDFYLAGKQIEVV